VEPGNQVGIELQFMKQVFIKQLKEVGSGN
jgi:hypothetical protein